MGNSLIEQEHSEILLAHWGFCIGGKGNQLSVSDGEVKLIEEIIITQQIPQLCADSQSILSHSLNDVNVTLKWNMCMNSTWGVAW